ncbi:hypothetical protein Leryth_010083 [Lithospermum erythrorhizon]|nr:hypothetical protein Leryth_010083 [Lithospermum erythrorhizon]
MEMNKLMLEDEEERFHDSLDRLLSSSNTSCSDDDDDENSGNTYDIWISQPYSSVEERRLNLLRQMGLTHDRSASQSRSVDPPAPSLPDRLVKDPACLIKDLDNGKEFEIKEDGSRNRLKEVGTGRQLTMEEFDKSVGTSPIVQELMRRQSKSDDSNAHASASLSKNKPTLFTSIRDVASSLTARSSDDRDTSSEKGGRRSSSATDDSQDAPFHGPERVRVRHYGKSVKELTALYRTQEIQAHDGSIWSIKFSLDGKYLASAGEDCVIHVWQVMESERKGDLLFDKPEDGNLNLLFMANGSPEPTSMSPSLDYKRRKGRSSISRKSVSLEHILVPETVFSLSDKPFCSFQGHMDDVLDLSWSKSQKTCDIAREERYGILGFRRMGWKLGIFKV